MTEVQLSDLAGTTVIRISRIHFSDPSIEQEYVASETLVLTLSDESHLEILTLQNETKVARLAFEREIFLSYESEPDEVLTLTALGPEEAERLPPLPLKISNVTELRTEHDELFAILLGDRQDSARMLRLCTETDEIELLTESELRGRIRDRAINHPDLQERVS